MTLLSEYIELATAWGAAMDDADADTANQLYDRVRNAFATIHQQGEDELLFERVDRCDDAVSFFIASHLVKLDPRRALAVYERLAQSSKPYIAHSAKYIVKDMRSSDCSANAGS